MKRSKWSTEKIVSILKEADAGVPVSELCRKYGMSERQACKLVCIERSVKR